MRKWVLIVALASSSIAQAGEFTGKIVSVLAGEYYGNMVFIEVSPKPTDSPACQTNPRYSFVFDPTTPIGKIMLGIALTAYTAEREVYIDGYNSCSVFNGVESMRQIRAK